MSALSAPETAKSSCCPAAGRAVAVTATPRTRERIVVFTIADQGIGIPHADLAYLFEPFHRGSNVGAIQGTGLGLSIAMRLVELHRGTIDVASEEGVGTTFTLRLPVRAPRHTAADGGDVSLQ